ncbi:MAG: hypothetical protein U0586_10125 [Candidatus Brocadiaceae bacterium]
MKTILRFIGKVLFLFFLLFLAGENVYAQSGWQNYYCVPWRDTNANTLLYAKQMGYDYISAKSWDPTIYTNNPDYAGFKFYIIDPQNEFGVYKDIPEHDMLGNDVQHGRLIDKAKTYTQAQKDWYEQHMVWKSSDPFPNNLATSIFPDLKPTRFAVMWDFQQQAVIDELVEKLILTFKSYENPSLPFTFAGWGIDVPLLNTEFRYLSSEGTPVRITLAYWTGMDSGIPHSNMTQDYATYTEGVFAFYKKLNKRMKQEFPDAKWFIDPARIYSTTFEDEWIHRIKDRPDKDALTPDMIAQEGPVTDFADDDNIFNSGVNITRDRVGCEQRREVDESTNRLIAAKAGINGSWYNWFGQFGISGLGSMPDFKSITDVYPRLKLVRCIPNWDNLNNVPLKDRSWNESKYKSPKSFISSDVMYSRHPKTGKLFAVFLTKEGIIRFNEGESVTSVMRADGFFKEAAGGVNDIIIGNNKIRLKSSVNIDLDSSNGQIKGNGYIFTLTSQTDVPTALTKRAKDITSNSATLRGMANPHGLKTSVWFQYGTASGSYEAISSVKTLKKWRSLDTGISIKINGLSSQTTYFYRIAAENEAGTTYGEEKKFTTQ